MAIAGLAAAGWFAAGPAVTAHAQTVEQFYKGRTINLLQSSSPGGIGDIASRLVGRYANSVAIGP